MSQYHLRKRVGQELNERVDGLGPPANAGGLTSSKLSG